ncbi:unnamed protein product [Rhizophagus irregularis]|nr:unnamed protein product [Rhizophagus irregularis]
MRKRKASVAFNDDLRLPLWDRYYSLGLSRGTREENTELKSRVAGNDQGSLALDEKSQNVKEVIAEVIAVSAVNISDQLNNANTKMSGDIESVSNKAPFDCAPSEQHQVNSSKLILHLIFWT